MVVIMAFVTNADCKDSLPFEGSSESLLSISAAIFVFMSVAAALVKVTTRISSISTGFSSSVISPSMRSTKTVVLPLPAAADTIRSLPL